MKKEFPKAMYSRQKLPGADKACPGWFMVTVYSETEMRAAESEGLLREPKDPEPKKRGRPKADDNGE